MADGLEINVAGDEEIQAVVEALSEVEGDLPGDFRQVIHDKAEELAQKARENALAEPTHGAKHTGLRAKLAEGTTVEDTSDGASITVQTEGEDDRLPVDMDDGNWWHPVYGHRNEWVNQGPYEAWFDDAMDDTADEELENALADKIQDAIDKIASA